MAGIVTAGLIGGGIQALGGLAQAASGIFGKKKRQRKLNALLAQRPKYKIPTEIKQDMEMMRNRKDGRLAEQQDMKNALFTNAQNTVARAQAASGSLEDQLAIGASAGAGMQDALIKNRMAGAQERAQRISGYRESLTNMAQAKDQAFKLNELDPFKMKVQGTLANDAMSREMTFGGINQAGAGLANMGTAGTAAGNTGFFQ
jgi:hypothetical protein